MDATKFPHQPHRSPAGDEFRIDNEGTAVHVTFSDGRTLELTGQEAKELREYLSKCELRTPDEAKLSRQNPPGEVNTGFKVELGDNKHVHVATLEEAEALKAKIAAKLN